MPRVVSEEEARQLDPEFFTKDRGNHSWNRRPDSTGHESVNYGGIALLYVIKDDGTVDHNRGVAWEPSEATVNVTLTTTQLVLVGDKLYERPHIGVIHQMRPFALNADGTEPAESITFTQPVMAFRNKLLGESSEETVIREALEEAGVTRVRSIEFLGHHWPNPTFIRSATQVWALEVEPESVFGDLDKTEFILKFEFLPLEELDRRIALGEYEGVNYRAAVAISTWAIWKANHPEKVLQAIQTYQAILAEERARIS